MGNAQASRISTLEASPALAADASPCDRASIPATQGAGLTSAVECAQCDGTGYYDWSGCVCTDECGACGGRGTVCSWCGGRLTAGDDCTACHSATEERQAYESRDAMRAADAAQDAAFDAGEADGRRDALMMCECNPAAAFLDRDIARHLWLDYESLYHAAFDRTAAEMRGRRVAGGVS